MGQKAKTPPVEIHEFRGMASAIDRHDLQPGQAKAQVNVTSTRYGELRVRRGLKELVYDSEE